MTNKKITKDIYLNSYNNISEAIYDYANSIKENFKSDINIAINKDALSIDYSKQLQATIFRKAKEMFSKIGRTTFENNGDKIYVSNSDIKESIAKTIRNTEQKKLIVEHLNIFKHLDKIIKSGELIAKGEETKERTEYKIWYYYATPVYINGKKFIIQFDIVLRTDGEIHFRLERIYSLKDALKKQIVPTGKIKK